MAKSVLIYSGGLDSTVLLYKLLSEGYEPLCLSVDYGQRHRREIYSAGTICENLGLSHKIVNLCSLNDLLSSSALTNQNLEVPEGHYTDSSMKATVVPNRNMVLLSLGIAWAVNEKAESVSYAAHAGDHTIYPDCRPEFVKAMEEASRLCDWHEVKLETPFLNMSKTEIVALGSSLSVPFEATWSCYKGGEKHCGKCGTCVERIEAFKDSGVADPTEYEDL